MPYKCLGTRPFHACQNFDPFNLDLDLRVCTSVSNSVFMFRKFDHSSHTDSGTTFIFAIHMPWGKTFPCTVIILAVRSASYTHKNRWGRIISKDMRPMGRILESASNIYKVDLECVLPLRLCPHCKNSITKTRILAMAAAIFDWVRNSSPDSDSGLFALRTFGPLFLPII